MTRVISAISTKGGAGKSTTIRILASQLAHEGKTVAILDTDPQNSCVDWLNNAEKNDRKIENVGFMHIEKLTDIQRSVALLDGNVDYVLLDVQGRATDMILPVVLVSELIVLPWGITQDDWAAVISSFQIITNVKERHPNINPKIVLSPNRVKVTDLNNGYVKARFEVAEKLGVIALETLLWERTLYKEMLVTNGSIPLLPEETKAISTAKDEHKAYAREIVKLLGAA